jgi:hypothetical protein
MTTTIATPRFSHLRVDTTGSPEAAVRAVLPYLAVGA